MARTKKDALPSVITPLNDEQVDVLRSGIEKIEKLEERTAQINADKRAAYDHLTQSMQPLGYEASDLKALVTRRKKDRGRVTEQDVRVYKLEVALGMRTADLFDNAAESLQKATTSEQATDASLAAGNAATALQATEKKTRKAKESKPPAETVDGTPIAPVSDDEIAEQFKAEGRAAWARGAGNESCKYKEGTREFILWTVGWDEAQAEWDAEQEDSKPPSTPAGNNIVTLNQPLKGADYARAVGADL